MMSVKVPFLLSDGMVLQRGTDVRLWGTANEPVMVTFLGQQYQAAMGSDGSWEVILCGLEPGGPHILTINEITIKDVWVGDVWLCSGQSNMRFPMERAKYMYPEEMKNPNPHIRVFTVPEKAEFGGSLDDFDSGAWVSASPETIGDFTAVGYFFAKRLYERLGIPIGLLACAVGGTPIHAWMSRDMLYDFPELLQEADCYMDSGYVERERKDSQKRMEVFLNEIDENDPGLVEKWYAPDYDDSGWEERELLEHWEGTGSVWLRKTLEIPAALGGKSAMLFLGTLIDSDVVYINGEKVGQTDYRYPPREYKIPALPKGRCVITVRVISRNGGHFTPDKQYLLSAEAGAFDLNNTWRFHRGGSTAPVIPETTFNTKPTALYNGMLTPLRKYTIKGAIWYQGESDTDQAPDTYAAKFEKLVYGWRADWGYDFPFFFVELANWNEAPHWHILRKQQRLSLTIPQTGMAAAADLGEHNDLHPQAKQAVGDRLARCALRLAYGEKLPPSPFEIFGYHEENKEND